MNAVSLLWKTNMAAVMPCKKALYDILYYRTIHEEKEYSDWL